MDDDEEWSVDDEDEQEDEEGGERDGRDDAMIQYCNSKYIVLWLLYMVIFVCIWWLFVENHKVNVFIIFFGGKFMSKPATTR